MRIVVSGLAATYPLGGVFWDYLQYVQGLTDLGHEVLYFENAGAWCYDLAKATMIESGAKSAKWMSQQCDRCFPDLRNNWIFRDARGTTYGSDAKFSLAFCRTAELLLNISGATSPYPDQFPRARKVYIDSDPMYSQENIPGTQGEAPTIRQRRRFEIMRSHDAFLTFGENIGQPGCLMPTQLFDWHPTRQPILVDLISRYRVPPIARNRQLTTIGTWEDKPLSIDGRSYFGKRREFMRFRHLPRQSALPFALAMSGIPPDLPDAKVWNFIDPVPISAGAESYLQFLASSFGEWSVAKHAYVASWSGWFSGRTALYLALGVPAIVQDTGFSRFLPTGEGLLAFSTPDEALAAIESVASNYERHCTIALEIAREHFDAKRVLSQLIDDAFSTSSPARSSKSTQGT